MYELDFQITQPDKFCRVVSKQVPLYIHIQQQNIKIIHHFCDGISVSLFFYHWGTLELSQQNDASWTKFLHG